MFEKIGLFSSGVKDGMVVMLNASGSALVSMYDKSVSRVNQARSAVVPSEKNKLEHSIRECITKIHSLQYEIGVASARNRAADSPDDLALRATIARMQDCQNSVEEMKKRLAEIEQERKAVIIASNADKQAAKQGAVQTLPVNPDVEVADASAEAAADAGLVAEPVMTERNETVRVLTGRAKKDGTCCAGLDTTDSMAA
jgi:hypothetical protein